MPPKQQLAEWVSLKSRPEWVQRSRYAVDLLPEDTTSVLELGCYDKALRDLLPEGCVYFGSDMYDRGEGTILCDLNTALVQFPSHDYFIATGILEWIADIPRLLRHLRQYCRKGGIVSYAFRDPYREMVASEDAAVALFTAGGFVVEERWTRDPSTYVLWRLSPAMGVREISPKPEQHVTITITENGAGAEGV